MDTCRVEVELKLASGGKTWREGVETGEQTPGGH